MILTHKRSLLESSCPVITEYKELKTGLQLDGTVVSIKDSGLLVVFFGNIKVGLPLNPLVELQKYNIRNGSIL